MPRPDKPQESKILKYFQSAPLPVATLVLGLAREAVRERQQKSAAAKGAAASVGRPFSNTTPRPAGPKPIATRKARKLRSKSASPGNGGVDTYVEDAGV